jgi:hypothetical protein
MTKGGRFLPGHDAKLKGFLKAAARDGLEDAFDKLMAFGWAQPSDKAKLMGFQAPQPVEKQETAPAIVQKQTYECAICHQPLTRDEYESGFHHCHNCWGNLTPADALKATARMSYLDLNDEVYDRIWDRAMRWGWPTHEDVLSRLQVLAVMARPDVHEDAVRTYPPSSKTRTEHHRNIDGKWYSYAARVGNYDVLRCTSNGGDLQVRRVSPQLVIEDAGASFDEFSLTAALESGVDILDLMDKLADEVTLYNS